MQQISPSNFKEKNCSKRHTAPQTHGGCGKVGSTRDFVFPLNRNIPAGGHSVHGTASDFGKPKGRKRRPSPARSAHSAGLSAHLASCSARRCAGPGSGRPGASSRLWPTP